MSLVDFYTNDSLFADFDRILDNAFARGTWRTPWNAQLAGSAPQVLRPRVDIREDKEKNLVNAMFELPGVNKESLCVGVHNSLLTVSGESRSESGSSGSAYLLRERRFRHFSRSVTVSEGIKPEEIKALMENGVLTVTYPHHVCEQISKNIAIS